MVRKYKLHIIIAFYLALRLTNLLILPIFNDEAIYIDWGIRETTIPGLAFYSLYDAKPPLLMWVFGMFHKFITNPLIAARLVSVIAGLLSLLGIYKISKEYFSEKVATWTSFFYIITPIFAFFDRQALMESAVAAAGIWSVYYFAKLLSKPSRKNIILYGFVLGVGIFIKQTSWVFLFSQLLVFSFVSFKTKEYSKIKFFLMAIALSQLVLLPMYLQSDFWSTLSTNNRFALNILEILRFPIKIWITNISSLLSISWWQIGPISIFILFSLIKFLYFKDQAFKAVEVGQKYYQNVYLIYGVVGLFMAVFGFRSLNPRYLVSLLPLLLVLGVDAIGNFNSSIQKKFFLVFCLLYPITLTLMLISNPLNYFNFLDKFTKHSQAYEYVTNWTNGFGTTHAINYLENISKNRPIIIGVRVDAGNPESAIFAYFSKHYNTVPLYFDSQFMDPAILEYDCITSRISFYFVARDGNLAGMDKYLYKYQSFSNPTKTSTVDLFKLNDSCEGKTYNMEI